MYPVSEAFMNEIESNTRKYYWTGTIVTNNKKEYAFGNEGIVKGSCYITRQCCGSSEIELGTDIVNIRMTVYHSMMFSNKCWILVA